MFPKIARIFVKLGTSFTNPSDRRRLRTVLGVEGMEDRTVPAAIPLTGPNGGAWVKIDTLTVATKTNQNVATGVTSNAVLAAGQPYLMVASGSARIATDDTGFTDAEYIRYNKSTGPQDGSSPGYAWNNHGVRLAGVPGGDTTGNLWGSYQSDHTYVREFVGQGTTVTGYYSDIPGYYGDNSGTLTVDIYGEVLGTIGGTVWHDETTNPDVPGNGDGIRQDYEPVVRDVVVELLAPSGTVVRATVTDSLGAYSFTGLSMGAYSVRFTLPTGFQFTLQNRGASHTSDSDVTDAGITGPIWLTGQEPQSEFINAGLIFPPQPSETRPPVLDAVPDQFITPGQPYWLQLWATDPDNELVTYTASELPAGLDLDAAAGTIKGTLPAGAFPAGSTFEATFTATDPTGLSSTKKARFTVGQAVLTWLVNTKDDTNFARLSETGIPIDATGKTSLRAAIEEANRLGNESISTVYIAFDPTVFTNPTTITLSREIETITGRVSITGTGMESLTIAGTGTRGIFSVGLTGSLAMYKLTVQDGKNLAGAGGAQAASGRGGAISNAGDLCLDSVRIRGCIAYEGGAISNGGRATLLNSVLINNQAVFTPGRAQGTGGAIDSIRRMTISGCHITDNTCDSRGGGIAGRAGAAFFLKDTEVAANSGQGGGGIYNSGGYLGMVGGSLNRNKATAGEGGGLLNEKIGILTGVAIRDNSASNLGGGVFVGLGPCILNECSFTGDNTAREGGKVATKAREAVVSMNNTNLIDDEIFVVPVVPM